MKSKLSKFEIFGWIVLPVIIAVGLTLVTPLLSIVRGSNKWLAIGFILSGVVALLISIFKQIGKEPSITKAVAYSILSVVVACVIFYLASMAIIFIQIFTYL